MCGYKCLLSRVLRNRLFRELPLDLKKRRLIRSRIFWLFPELYSVPMELYLIHSWFEMAPRAIVLGLMAPPVWHSMAPASTTARQLSRMRTAPMLLRSSKLSHYLYLSGGSITALEREKLPRRYTQLVLSSSPSGGQRKDYNFPVKYLMEIGFFSSSLGLEARPNNNQGTAQYITFISRDPSP
ncbi:uncharacterized protein EI90DRAFT_1232455 [Cantharellus anzutake]|uniref:uncharacterized protein n=1 Tax=Cantharellus anzutake TaxID=1750568 RepID=UPI00190453CB|nr:uncharacterized protein EI90DRAFT_1232455 [Cantharellus anzutake]KAF8330195.1 hypothetical protein EI90DRAFT_1232455 [Cantharellus anzutake]